MVFEAVKAVAPQDPVNRVDVFPRPLAGLHLFGVGLDADQLRIGLREVKTLQDVHFTAIHVDADEVHLRHPVFAEEAVHGPRWDRLGASRLKIPARLQFFRRLGAGGTHRSVLFGKELHAAFVIAASDIDADALAVLDQGLERRRVSLDTNSAPAKLFEEQGVAQVPAVIATDIEKRSAQLAFRKAPEILVRHAIFATLAIELSHVPETTGSP